jgi:hypothetical protein
MVKLDDISFGYKSALNFSNYRNFIRAVNLKKPESELANLKEKLFYNCNNDLLIYNLSFYKDLVLLKYEILLSMKEISILPIDFYNIIIGTYINKILQKGTQSRLFPISIKSIENELKYDDTYTINKKYVDIRKKFKNELTIIGTYTMVINGRKIAGCGESCVYNYINKLLYKDDVINVDLFPHNLKDTKLYKFYVDIFKGKNIGEQNILIQKEDIFNKFAILLINYDNVDYVDKVNKIEFIPYEKNFTKLFYELFKIDKNIKIENMIEMTEYLYKIFHNEYDDLSLNMNKLTIDNHEFTMSHVHCTTTTINDIMDVLLPIIKTDSILSKHYILEDYIEKTSYIEVYETEIYEYNQYDDDEIEEIEMNRIKEPEMLKKLYESQTNGTHDLLLYKILNTAEDYYVLIKHYEDAFQKHNINLIFNDKDVLSCGFLIKYINIEKQTYEMCLNAVQTDGSLLKYVNPKFQDYDLCVEAIKNHNIYEFIFKYVKTQSYELCLKAVEIDGRNLQYVKDEFRDNKIIMTAINKKYSSGFEYVKPEEQTYEMCLNVVKRDGINLRYVNSEFRTNELIITAIQNSHRGYAINAVKIEDRTYEMWLEAVKNFGEHIKDVPSKFKDHNMYLEALKDHKNEYLRLIPEEDQTYELCIEAVKINFRNYRFIKSNVYYKVLMYIVKNSDEFDIKNNKYEFQRMCEDVLKVDKSNIQYIKKEYITNELLNLSK